MAISYLVCFQVQLTDIICIEAVMYPIIVVFFWANYFPKCLNLCTFLWWLLYILLDWTQSEMYILTTFHKRAVKEQKCKEEKELLNSIAFMRGTKSFELVCDFDLLAVYSPFWLTNFIYLCKMIGGLICPIGMEGLFVVTQDHTHTNTRMWQKIQNHNPPVQ